MTIASSTSVRRVSAARNYLHVLQALILRDIKSRFLGSAWGYFVSIGWPLSHIVLLLLVHGAFGRLQPYGESATVWYSTGIVPFMAFSYTLRFVVLGLLQNSPLLSFPAVRVLDIVLARAIVEIFSVSIVFFVLAAALEIMGMSFIPDRPLVAFYALFLSFVLGLSFGIIFGGLSKISPGWNTVSMLFVLTLWAGSGIFFVPTYFPSFVLEILYASPLIHIIDLFRSAYFDGFAEERANVTYAVCWCAGSLFISLLLERLLRGRITQ